MNMHKRQCYANPPTYICKHRWTFLSCACICPFLISMQLSLCLCIHLCLWPVDAATDIWMRYQLRGRDWNIGGKDLRKFSKQIQFFWLVLRLLLSPTACSVCHALGFMGSFFPTTSCIILLISSWELNDGSSTVDVFVSTADLKWKKLNFRLPILLIYLYLKIMNT